MSKLLWRAADLAKWQAAVFSDFAKAAHAVEWTLRYHSTKAAEIEDDFSRPGK